MLKDKYSFTVTPVTADTILHGIHSRINEKSERAHFLCVLCLDKFCQKLILTIHRPGKVSRKISLNKMEQLAMHIGYKEGYFDTNNIFIQEIFTAIDKTL